MKTRCMKLKTAVVVIVPLLLLVSIMGLPVAQVYAIEPLVVGIESAEDVVSGSEFVLSIYLEDAINIVGLGFELYWDPAVINIPSIRLSDDFKTDNDLTVGIDPDLGKAIVALVNTEYPDYLIVIENTPILDLTIEVVGSPGDSTILNLEKVELSDADFTVYPPDIVIDGFVSIYTPGIISISVDPGDIDFGQIYEGDSGTSSVNITNDGNVEVSVTATLVSEDPVGFYTDNLKIFEIGLGYVYVVEWNLVLPSKYEESVPLELTIPYLCSAGDKTAILTFWAETP